MKPSDLACVSIAASTSRNAISLAWMSEISATRYTALPPFLVQPAEQLEKLGRLLFDHFVQPTQEGVSVAAIKY